jgi:hypothetical protein
MSYTRIHIIQSRVFSRVDNRKGSVYSAVSVALNRYTQTQLHVTKYLARWIAASAPMLQEHWDVGGYVLAAELPDEWVTLGDLRARFRDGVKVSAEGARALGLYRPSSIRGLQLHDDELGSLVDDLLDHERVATGDVVLSKFLPVRAAWVAPSTTRRGADPNCVRITGLEEHVGFWVAAMLEHAGYQQYLRHRAAGSMLPRIGLRDLKSLRVPRPPIEVRRLAARWVAATDAAATARQELAELQSEIEVAVQAEAPTVVDSRIPQFYKSSDLSDEWTPARAARDQFQAEARAKSGWVPLGRFESEHIGRMRSSPEREIRVLRLGDADGGLGFRLPEPEAVEHASFRFYAESLLPDEVLLSVLATAPKVVFNYPAPKEEEVWVADHWFRLDGRKTPGVLAMLLRTEPVTWQLNQMASGMAQQYIARSDLVEVVLPNPARLPAVDWERRLRPVLDAAASAQRELDAIRTETAELVGRHLGGRA